VFDLYGARNHLDEVHGFGPYPGTGECTNVGTLLRRRIYPILTRWLNVPTPTVEYHDPLPDSKLMCLTPAIAAERRPKTASAIALELARHRLAEARFGDTSVSELRRALKEKLGDIEPFAKPSAQLLWEKSGPQATVEALAIETAPGITLPVLLLKPPHPTAKRSPAVLAVAEGGKARFLAHRGEELVTLLRNGMEICLLDVRGTGEVAATSSRGTGAVGLAETELMLGETMLGSRLKDVRTVFHYLASRPDVDPAHIALWGDSFAETNPDNFAFDQSEMQEPGPFPQHQAEPMGALVALLAGLYEDRVAAIAARGGVVSFLSVLEDRFCHLPQDAIVPGVLEAADVADIVAARDSRPILLEGFVDGRNRVARNAKLQAEFARALKASPRLVVREAPGDLALPAWLASLAVR
jgi:hypothetical protein